MVKSDAVASFCQKPILGTSVQIQGDFRLKFGLFSNADSAVLTSHRMTSDNIGQYKVICAHSWLNNHPDSLKGNKQDSLYFCQLANVELP